MHMKMQAKKMLQIIVFLILSVLDFIHTDYTIPNMLCPQGYWPAKVNTNGGPYKTDRTFKLPYMPNAMDQVCQFCPNVGCYVLRINEKTGDKIDKEQSSSQTTPKNFDKKLDVDHSNNTDTDEQGQGQVQNLNTNSSDPNSEFEPKSPGSESTTHRTVLYMSCDRWNNLPDSKDIESYLDCVMIGTRLSYYLFIYEPRFREQPLPAVDCVDADFLAWIDNGTEILGLELGFPMKTIPPYLLRYSQRIMQSIEYICIDGTSLINNSIEFENTERFSSNRLTQVVFRSTPLSRDRPPPRALDSHLTMEYHTMEKVRACPFVAQHKPANITPNEDCQFSPGGLPTTSDKVKRGDAIERCPYRDILASKPKVMKRIDGKHSKIIEEAGFPPSILSACLLMVVLVLTTGIIIAFCIMNHQKLMLCRSRSSKRREAALALELAEQAAKEAAIAAANEAAQQNAMRQPIYARYGMPSNMGGAFGVFAPRPMDLPAGNMQNNNFRPN